MDEIVRTDSPVKSFVVFSGVDAIPIAVDKLDVDKDIVLWDGVGIFVRVMF